MQALQINPFFSNVNSHAILNNIDHFIKLVLLIESREEHLESKRKYCER